MSTSILPTSPQPSKPTLLTLPAELRQQIYHHAFSNLSLQLPTTTTPDCHRCQTTNLSTPLPGSQTTPFANRHLFTRNFLPLLTCRQIHTEASPLFYTTLTLALTSPHTLDAIRTKTRLDLRDKLTSLSLTVHLTDDSRVDWYHALTALPSTFPNLAALTLHNHMRSPISYDRLIDAVYLCAPLVSSPLLPVLTFAYARDEVMFESPFLGDITTEDSLDAHEAVVRDLMADDGFRECAVREDFDGMTGRLLFVARGHEQRWLEGLQRRRLAGLSAREVQERLQREVMAGVGMEIVEGYDGDEEEGAWEE